MNDYGFDPDTYAAFMEAALEEYAQRIDKERKHGLQQAAQSE